MCEVLIIGAGPTGLVLAIWLTKQKVKVRIIDKSAGPGDSSRAMAVQARTLELYEQVDLSEKVVNAGHQNPSINLWAKGVRRASLSFGDAGRDVTPYPFILVYPQDEHERLLIDQLTALGIDVERETELIKMDDDGQKITAWLRLPDGREEMCETQFLAGCDGAGSTVRHQLGIGFPGGTYNKIFYVADVELTGLEPADEVHVALDSDDFVAVLAYGKSGKRRLIGTVRADKIIDNKPLTFEDVSHHALHNLKATVKSVNWFSTYRVHHRVAEQFSKGHVFLLGDAAHVHSPAGGQGMNTGILDAINLAWKLAAVIRTHAPESLLESYELERLSFARKLVSTTDRMFSLMTKEGSVATQFKMHVLPLFASLIYSFGSTRSALFRIISQTMLEYHHSPLSKGDAGKIRGGDRLPWLAPEGYDNYVPLREMTWQIHILGTATKELVDWCEAHAIPLHNMAWKQEYADKGFAENAVYLIRPDTWIAMVDQQGRLSAITDYFTALGFERVALSSKLDK